jgi:RNA polymerase sigma factor (sigma-70 family)
VIKSWLSTPDVLSSGNLRAMSTPVPDPQSPPSPPLPITRLEELVHQLRPRLRRILWTYRIPYPDSEDLLQDLFVAAFSQWDTIHTHDAWLLGTFRNKCYLYWKKRRSDRLQAMDMTMLESVSEPLPPSQEQAERLWDLETLFGSLCPRHRTVLWLRYGLGMTPAEIAAHTGYNHSSIRKLTCRSVARLQRELRAGPKSA